MGRGVKAHKAWFDMSDYGKTGIKRWIAKRSEGDPLVEAA